MSTPPPSPGAWRRALAGIPGTLRHGALVERLLAAAAGFVPAASGALAPDRSWHDLGFDSLRAVDFAAWLAPALGLELRSTLLFDEPTPQRLAAHLLDRLGLTEPAGPPVTATPRPTSAPAVAIVGAACRFPGGESLEEFWRLLREGRDAVVPFGNERFDFSSLYDPDPAADGKLYVRAAGLLRDHDTFDATFFGISPREAVMLDPQQRLLLEVAWHALEHANLPPHALAAERVGVYIAIRESEYFDSQTARQPADADAWQATGNAASTAAGRIAYTFGFRGPCYALDTACSGSLVALHVAVRALRAGECDVALAGGVNAIYDVVPMVGLCRARMLSPDGRSKAFAASADGYGRGEGCGIVVMKRLADAERDGDRILAVVCGTAINQDGRSGGLTVPHGPAQTEVVQQALADAGLSPDAIDYVEAHGTGTTLGDPIEVGALQVAFATRTAPLPIGSVKTNIGHLEAAAGVSGLLKVVHALRERRVPPTLHCDVPTPHVDWSRSIVQPCRSPWPLPASGQAFAGVSSFGFSGTNAHVIVGAADHGPDAPPPPRTASSGPWLLPLQAADPAALRALAREHADALSRPGIDLGAWCHALSVARSPLPLRAAFVSDDPRSLAAALRAFADGDDAAASAEGHAGPRPPRLAFLFPGQGAHRPGMGRELAAVEPTFAASLRESADSLAPHLATPLSALLADDTGRLDHTDAAQPALCAMQLALLALLRSVGVTADFLLGHSVGDYAAAVAAGVLAPDDALRLCAHRGRLMVERCERGGMLAVLAAADGWQELLAAEPGLAIAVHNGPAHVVVGGDDAALQRLHAELRRRGIAARRLPVSHAFHTAAMAPMLAPFATELAPVSLRPPTLPLVDTRRGEVGGAPFARHEHWVEHVRQPVRFDLGLEALAATDATIWLELGVVPLLTRLAGNVAGSHVHLLCTQDERTPGRASWLSALAALWVRGVPVDLAAANHGTGRPRVDLPLYPFQRQRYWLAKNGSAAAPEPSATPLLGPAVASSRLAPGESSFVRTMAANDPPWLADHRVAGSVLLPAAAMLDLALAAERRSGQALPLRLHDVRFVRPCELGSEPMPLELLRTTTADGAAIALRSRAPDGSWRVHAEAQAGGATTTLERLPIAAIATRCGRTLDASPLRARAAALGLDYGPAFHGLQRAQVGADEALAEVRIPAAAEGSVLDPRLLDAAFQAVLAILQDATTLLLPIGVEAIEVHRAGTTAARCHVRLRRHDGTGTGAVADLVLADEHGVPFASVTGLQLVPAAAPTAATPSNADDHLHHEYWDAVPPAPPGPLPARVVVVDLGGSLAALPAAIAGSLPAGGVVVCPPAGLAAALAARCDHVVLVAGNANADVGASAVDLLRAALVAVRTVVNVAATPRVSVVTHGAQPAFLTAAGPVPIGALLGGVLRTLRLEHGDRRAHTIDLDPLLPASDPLHAMAVIAELRGPGDEPEVALRSGRRLARRIGRGPGGAPLPLPPGAFHIRAQGHGGPEQLTARPFVRRVPGPGEVEVAILAAGLIWKDVLYLRGLLAEYAAAHGVRHAADQPIGFEGVGVITAVGPGVVDRAVGERVLVLAAACLASHACVRANATCPLPPGIDAVAAAGMPTAFATVFHALADVARVDPGEVVLVHGAAGGVGQAALQWLARRGARALATADAGKHAFLRARGVEVVGDSRTTTFEAAVRAATGGRGVDVVLNTTTGERAAASLRVLRPGGRFVEIGKLGALTPADIATARPDVRHAQFDLADAFEQNPALMPDLLARLHRGLADRSLQPLPTLAFAATHAREAFAHFASGRHVGKVVVRMPSSDGAAVGCWLLTGASGGIAPAIVDALVASGVRSLALLARSALPPERLAELRARGVRVLPLTADVADRDALTTALAKVRAELGPLRGVVHAAGALADGVLAAIDAETAVAAQRAKVLGAIWLDELTAADDLSHFVVVTSMAGTLGNPGQAAYAGANTFLDAFAAWRRARGRPGAAFAFGPWAGAGMSERLDPRLRQRLHERGVGSLDPTTAARLLFAWPEASLAVLPMRWPQWLRAFGDVVPPTFRGLQPAAATATPAAAAPFDLAAVPAAERANALRPRVRGAIAAALGFRTPDQLDPERTFRDHGLDSLLAIDAKDRIETLLGIPLPATLLFDHPDLDRLVAHLLAVKFPATSADDGLGSLGDAALARLLADELRRGGDAP
mgnify:CR=1 FL=1